MMLIISDNYEVPIVYTRFTNFKSMRLDVWDK